MSKQKKEETEAQQNEAEKRSPLLSIPGEYQLTVWANRNNVRIVVNRRTENGWERVAKWVVPLDYLLFKIAIEVEGGLDVIKQVISRIKDEEE